MSVRLGAVAALTAACLLPCAADAEEHGKVQMQRDVTWRLSLEIAQGAIEACARRNVSISVAVVDRAGRVRVFISSDNPSPHSLELARRKAYTARTFGRSTLEWRDNSEPGKEAAGQRHCPLHRSGVAVERVEVAPGYGHVDPVLVHRG